jgi:hypothetical protein
MEKLLPDVPSVASLIFPEELPDKTLYVCVTDSVGQLADEIRPTSPHFGLLVAMDAKEIASDEIFSFANKTLTAGLVYLCAWGPDCERVHDLFDEEYLARELGPPLWGEEQKTRKWEDVLMTTSHADDSLEDALWFFVHSAVPTASYRRTCTDWVVAIVGNCDWEQEIRAKIRKVAYEFPED